MKGKFILLGSLGLNLLLAAVWLFWPRALPRAAHGSPAVIASAASVTNLEVAVSFSTNVLAFRWASVESEDYRQYIINLRALHCPERLIRDILVADLEKLYARKAREFLPARYQLEPWAGRERRDIAALADRQVTNTREAELVALIHELLGVDWTTKANQQWKHEPIMGVLLGFLTDEKAPQVITLIDRTGDESRRLRDETVGIFLPDDLKRLEAIGDGLMADLAQRLTPPELDELRMRAQAFLVMMERELHFDGVELTGVELKEIARASLVMTDVLREEIARGSDQEVSKDERARRKAEFELQVAKILGVARWADYQLAQNGDFRDALEFTKEKILPKPTAIAVSRAFTDTREQAAQIRKDKSLSTDERRTLLTTLAAALRSSLHATLGANAAEFIKDNHRLLDELVPPPKPEEKK